MNRCFVIQPFDGAAFDRRYDDVLAPAIRDAGLDPYRVDRDHSVEVPIEDIEAGIRNARACLADITTDNPNVWFELGFAIAAKKDVVLICSTDRGSRFPFDVQHRRIITYSTTSPSDFEKLRSNISGRLSAIVRKRPISDVLFSPVSQDDGLAPHEKALLATVMQNQLEPDNVVSVMAIRDDMDKAGFTKIAISLGLRTLLSQNLIALRAEPHWDGEPVSGYVVTGQGESWLMENLDSVTLQRPPEEDDDLPF